MVDIVKLNKEFSLGGIVKFSGQKDELISLTVSNKYAEAKISMYGAHMMSFRPRNSEEVLWMSPKSNFEVGRPIRGGIPVCFPWFGPHKTDPGKPQHGFGRLMYWQVTETSVQTTGETLVRLQMDACEKTRTFWPFDFTACLTVIVGQTLIVSLEVLNRSTEDFEYTCALHSYYNISTIGNITISGLKGTSYHSQIDRGEYVQESTKLEINNAETRHYYNTEATCILEDKGLKRKIRIAKAGSRVTTVWNPGKEACATMEDMPSDAYLHFVCVEAVNAFSDVIKLLPEQSHTTSIVIGLE
jgi:glucose-6-phosphate 1-epimerase